MIKLNLGCGSTIKKGYINIDVRKTNPNVVIANVLNLPYEDNSVDEIFAEDIFEHISHIQSRKMIEHWIAKLKVGGTLYIKTTSLCMLAKMASESVTVEDIEKCIRRIFGGQNYKENRHMTIGHPTLFIEYLTAAGIDPSNIKIRDDGQFRNGTNMTIHVVK
jgi:hypothetical protein